MVDRRQQRQGHWSLGTLIVALACFAAGWMFRDVSLKGFTMDLADSSSIFSLQTKSAATLSLGNTSLQAAVLNTRDTTANGVAAESLNEAQNAGSFCNSYQSPLPPVTYPSANESVPYAPWMPVRITDWNYNLILKMLSDRKMHTLDSESIKLKRALELDCFLPPLPWGDSLFGLVLVHQYYCAVCGGTIAELVSDDEFSIARHFVKNLAWTHEQLDTKKTSIDIFFLDHLKSREYLESLDWRREICLVVINIDTLEIGEVQAIQDFLVSKGYSKAPWQLYHLCSIRTKDFKKCSSVANIFEHKEAGNRSCGSMTQVQKEDFRWLPSKFDQSKIQVLVDEVRAGKHSQFASMLVGSVTTECCDGKEGWNSQFGEDSFIMRSYFCGVKGGRYVEMGALDGQLFSNTKAFRDMHDWSGVLIEANPNNHQALRKNRPTDTIITTAICPEGVNNLTFVGQAGGVGGVVDTMALTHRKSWNGNLPTYTVPCQPLGKLLQEAKLTQIDFFSLDVEGAELEVLQTMDWDITVCIWLIELDGQNVDKDVAVRQLLISKGYRRSSTDPTLYCLALDSGEPTQACLINNEVFEHPSVASGKCGVASKKTL